MSDREKPSFNPESKGDLDDYWSSSASYHEKRQAHKAACDALIGTVSTKQDWLIALSKTLEQDDDYMFERLGVIAREWRGSEKEKKYMIEILGNVQNLQTCW